MKLKGKQKAEENVEKDTKQKTIIKSATSQWARTTKNTDSSTGTHARPFARLLALLTRSLTPHYLLRSCSLTRSHPSSWDSEWLFILCFFLFWPMVHLFIAGDAGQSERNSELGERYVSDVKRGSVQVGTQRQCQHQISSGRAVRVEEVA